jgi:hypothetical protein
LNSFIKLSADYPELLDFFDIFNNKLIQNMSIIITKDHVKKIEKITHRIKFMLDKINANAHINTFTIAIKGFVDRANKLRTTPISMMKNVDKFTLSHKMNRMNSQLSEDSIEISEDDESEQSQSENNEYYVRRQETLFTTNTDKNMFDFFIPSVIKNEEYIKEMADHGIDLNDCLIINKRKAFINYLKEIREYIGNLLIE